MPLTLVNRAPSLHWKIRPSLADKLERESKEFLLDRLADITPTSGLDEIMAKGRL